MAVLYRFIILFFFSNLFFSFFLSACAARASYFGYSAHDERVGAYFRPSPISVRLFFFVVVVFFFFTEFFFFLPGFSSTDPRQLFRTIAVFSLSTSFFSGVIVSLWLYFCILVGYEILHKLFSL